MRRQKVEYAAILTVPENIFMQEVLKGITMAQEELKDSGGRLSIRFMETIDGARQAQLIDQLVTKSVKGIVMIPVDCEAVRQAVARGVRRRHGVRHPGHRPAEVAPPVLRRPGQPAAAAAWPAS